MRDYIKIKVAVSQEETEKYLNNGWEIIETVKKSSVMGDNGLVYHLGLPSRVMIDRLKEIIKEYEKYGFKDLLFEKVAESYGEIASNYVEDGGSFTFDKTPNYMEYYERTVHNRKISISRK